MQDGQWAGHLELQALSLLLRANINVHQAEQPVWVISNFPADAASLHLSYHLGEHYNSVRLKVPGAPSPAKGLRCACWAPLIAGCRASQEDIASSKPAAHITLGSLPAAVGSSGADMHGPPGEARAAESSSSSSRGAGGAQQVRTLRPAGHRRTAAVLPQPTGCRLPAALRVRSSLCSNNRSCGLENRFDVPLSALKPPNAQEPPINWG